MLFPCEGVRELQELCPVLNPVSNILLVLWLLGAIGCVGAMLIYWMRGRHLERDNFGCLAPVLLVFAAVQWVMGVWALIGWICLAIGTIYVLLGAFDGGRHNSSRIEG